MRLLLVAEKSLKESIRQRRNLAIGLGLPVMFMLIFGLAFGAGATTKTFDVATLDQDGGDAARSYLEGLANLAYDDGTPVLKLTPYVDEANARRDVQARDQDALLVIPDGFTEGLQPGQRSTGGVAGVGAQPQPTPPPGTSVRLEGDPGSPDYGIVSRIVEGYTAAFEARATGREPVIGVEEEEVTSSSLTTFDRLAPGLMVFAVLNLVPGAAATLARESELGTLERVRQSPTRALELLGGVALAQIVLASVSVALMLLTAKLLGFHNQGSYAVAYVVALGAGLAVVGLGMVVAAFARTQQEAANIGVLISVPSSFLSGAFFELPPVPLFTAGGIEWGLYDLIPTTHAVEAMRAVLTFGRGFADVGGTIAVLGVLALLLFGIGVGLYKRQRLAPS